MSVWNQVPLGRRGERSRNSLRKSWDESTIHLEGSVFSTACRHDFDCTDKGLDDITAEHYLLPNSNKRLVFLNTTYADIYRFCQEYCDPKTNLQVAIIQNANGHGSQLETPSPSPWSVRMSGYASHMDSKSSYIFDYCESLSLSTNVVAVRTNIPRYKCAMPSKGTTSS